MKRVSVHITGLIMGLTITAQIMTSAAQAQTQERKKGLVDQLSGQGYGMAGCGLGSIIFGERPGAIQVFASTTNNFYSNNTFGVSSGTSNCEEATGSGAKAAKLFMENNRAAIENDVVRGSGETLSAFYDVAGCHESAEISPLLKANYREIFKQGSSSDEVIGAIRQTLRQNQSTDKSCPNLG